MRPSLTTTCVVDVNGREVHLSVRHEAVDVWRWEVLYGDDLML